MLRIAEIFVSVLLIGSVVSFIYYSKFGLSFPHFDEIKRYGEGSTEEKIWLCSPFVSYDSKTELDFLENNKLTISNKKSNISQSIESTDGDWKLTNNTVFIKIGQSRQSYKFVDIDSSRYCLLMTTENINQNISEIWYGGLGNSNSGDDNSSP